jgi:hypothetical protein
MASLDLETIQNRLAAAVASAAASAVAAAASANAAAASAVVPAKLTTLDATVGALPAGAITGSDRVTLISSNATPGTQTTRTAVAMVADATIVAPYAYNLRIVNTGAGLFTLAAGSGVTLGAGTNTVAQNTFRDFVVEFPTATTCTITTTGVGTYS